MAFYGNVLTVYDGDEDQMDTVRTILQNRSTRFERLGPNFFIETTSVPNTKDVVKDLRDLDIKFTFYHDHNSDGSNMATKGIEENKFENIRSILLE